MMADRTPFTPGRPQGFRPASVSDPRIPQTYVSIPKKQQILLDRDDAWSGSLRSGSHMYINVPPEVLEDVKAAYAQQRAPKTQVPSFSPQNSSPPVQQTPLQQQLRSSIEHSPGPRSDVASSMNVPQQAEEDSDDDLAVPWSSSPPRQHLRSPEIEQPSDKETDTQTTPSQGGSSPPRPIRDATRSRFLTEFPSSALDDGDLELEEPGVLEQQSIRMARPVLSAVAMPEPTPPSAQLTVIPCSFNPTGSPEKPQRLPRSGLMKPLKFDKSTSRVPAAGPDITKLRPETMRLRRVSFNRSALAQPREEDFQDSGPISTPAVAVTAIDPPSYESSKIPETSPIHLKKIHSSATRITFESSRESIVAKAPITAQGIIQTQVLEETIEDSASGSPLTPRNTTPWDVYQRTYPDFTGTVGDFVRACLCVLDLQAKKALPAFLYDDFIRAFAKDYLTYISYHEPDDHSQPLTAVQWYTENVDNPIYTKAVITRQNLQETLTAYPEEVGSAGLLAGSSEDVNQESLYLQDPATQAMDVVMDEIEEETMDDMDEIADEVTNEVMNDPASQPDSPENFATEACEEISTATSTNHSDEADQHSQTLHEPATQIMTQPALQDDLLESSRNPSAAASDIVEVKEENTTQDFGIMANVPPLPESAEPASRASEQSLTQEALQDPGPLPPPPTASSISSFRSKKRRSKETPEQRSKRWRALLEKRQTEGMRLSGRQAPAKRT